MDRECENLRVESVWWFWDEEEEMLKNGKGNIRRIQGRGKERKR